MNSQGKKQGELGDLDDKLQELEDQEKNLDNMLMEYKPWESYKPEHALPVKPKKVIGLYDDLYYVGMYGGKRWKSKIKAMIKDQEIYTRGMNYNQIRPSTEFETKYVKEKVILR